MSFYVLKIVIYILVALIGITVFSYLNVLVDQLTHKALNIKGRSYCFMCRHLLRNKEAIPIFSFIRQKGICPYCMEKIPLRYVLVEVLGGLTSCLCFWYYGIRIQTIIMFLSYGVLLAIALIDYDTMEIPFELNVVLFVLGVLSMFLSENITVVEHIIGFFCVSGFMAVIAFFIHNGFGGGDIKLMAAAGLLLGYQGIIVAFFISLLLGGAYGVYLLIGKKKKRKDVFAFGPFLCVGIAVASFGNFGIYLLNLYIQSIVF